MRALQLPRICARYGSTHCQAQRVTYKQRYSTGSSGPCYSHRISARSVLARSAFSSRQVPFAAAQHSSTGHRRSIRTAASVAQSATPSASPSASMAWPQQDKREMLHAVYRVGDMQASIDWYKKNFGAKLLRYRDVPEEKYSNAFLGFGDEDKGYFALELTYNYGVDSYDLGEGFGHFGLAVPDVYKTVETVRANGGKVTREAGPVKGGTTVIAFVEDPTGYKWELIQRPQESIRDPICQVMLRVLDLDASIKFYTEVLGLKLIRKRENEQYKYTLAFLGYGEETDSCVFELTHNWDRKEPYSKGDRPGYAQVAISTEDVFKTADVVKAAGGKVVREPGPIPGINTKITSVLDPDGWKVVFVDRKDFEQEIVEAAKAGTPSA